MVTVKPCIGSEAAEASFGDSAREDSNRNNQGQDEQQPEKAAQGEASGNRRHGEDDSENDQNKSHLAGPSAGSFSGLADRLTRHSLAPESFRLPVTEEKAQPELS